ncbi:MAG: MFS transporter, partial [Pseudomonadota bacterium]
LAFGGAGTLPITFTRPVANWFQKNRGIALGIALIATGMFGALAKFFAQFVVANEALHFIGGSGWRSAYVLLGLLPLTIALPLAYLSLRDLDDVPAADAPILKWKVPILAVSLVSTLLFIGIVWQQIFPLIGSNGLRIEYVAAFVFSGFVLVPGVMMLVLDIKKQPPVVQQAGAVELPGMSLREALADWRFWLLAVCFVPISYAVGAIIPNIERVLTASGGFEMNEAVGLATLTGLAVLSGRIIGGVLIDRFWAPLVAFVFLSSPAFALWLLAQPGLTDGSATLAILMIGFGAGVEYDFMAYIISKYFGMKAFSAIYGAVYGFFALGAGLGPTILTDIADGRGIHFFGIRTGLFPGHDWSFALVSAAIILVVSTVPLLFLGKYRYRDLH